MPRDRGTVVAHPRQFHDGRRIDHRHVVGGPRHDHLTIINNTTVINNINYYNRTEVTPGRYYWHDYGSSRYCHYYDTYGYHWYGWYIGDVYFWTRYWNDTYWYYDPYWGRWVYMRHGRWWYQDPVRVEVVYIYTPETNRYYRYDDAPSGGGAVLTPDPTPPVAQPPVQQPEDARKIFYSADGRRSVQLFGAANDAFLYDTAETPAFEPVYLASHATEARFNESEGQPLQVLLLTEVPKPDGTVLKGFELFDENGNEWAPPAPAVEPLPHETGSLQTPSPSPALDALKVGFVW